MKQALVVDNHPVMLEYMRGVLEGEGYEVHTADSGLAALDILAHVVPSVMFVDLIMPNIDGQTLCRLVRSMPVMQNTSLVILSAVAAEAKLDLPDLGADACIAKGPFSTLSGHVLRALEESGRSRTPNGTPPVYGLEDIYERQITRELLLSRRHLRIILDNMRDGMLEITPTGQIVYANPAALGLIGDPEVAVLGRHFLDIFRTEEKGRLAALLDEARQAGVVVTEQTSVVVRSTQVVLRFCPVKDPEQQSIIVLLVDVEERSRLHSQLQRAFRVESVAALAGGVAHEFNNALCEISGITSLLMDEAREVDDSMVGALRTTIRRMTELTDQLLSYGKPQAAHPARFDLSRFLRLNLPVIGHSLSPQTSIQIHVPEGGLYVQADSTQIQMALTAVITNASEAMGDAGEVTVRAEMRILDEEAAESVEEARPGRWVVVTVEDHGCGMSPDVRDRVFEPFFSTKAVGRGLGMAAAHGIINSHDGWITVDSEEGQGTAVRIFLPAAEA